MLNIGGMDPSSDLQVVDGKFVVQSDYSDSLAFFNLRPVEKREDENQGLMGSPGFGVGGMPGTRFDMGGNRDGTVFAPVSTPAAPQASAPSCHGNCQACVWSCLCKNSAKGFGAIGGFLPKLG
jgi:hypothetical protein